MSAPSENHRHPAARTPLWRHARRAAGRDPSPLCRPLDRAFSRLAVALALSLVGTLVLGAVVALLAFHGDDRAARQTARHRHSVTATTLGPAQPDDLKSGGTRAHAQASWTYQPTGPGAGRIRVPADTAAGTAVPIWVDDGGRPAGPATSRQVILADAVAIGFGAATVLSAAAAGAYVIRRRSLEQRAEQGWEPAWEQVEPLWSGRR